MSNSVMIVCLWASGLTNVFLLWLVWLCLKFGKIMMAQRNEMQDARLADVFKSNRPVWR